MVRVTADYGCWPDVFLPDGEVGDDSTADFIRGYVRDFREHLARVLTVLPRSA